MSERVRCYDCHRPAAHCLCELITPIEHRTEILILQHPRERGHAFNTARIAEMALRNATVRVGHGAELGADDALAADLRGYGLLYPRPGALDLSQLAPVDRPEKLIVLDGTWHHARAMYRDIEPLQSLPHFTLPAGQVSGFRIRKQPKDYCLSTIEAIQSALACLEPDTQGLDTLLRPFEAMQTQHMAAMGTPTPRRRKPRPFKEKSPLPPELKDAYGSLVVTYAEMGPFREPGEPRLLLTFAALRPATGERMQRVIACPDQPEEMWAFLRLSQEERQQACSIEDLRAAWRAFRRPNDVMAAWSRSTLDVIGSHLPEQGPTLLLKAAYCNRRAERGCLEQIVVKENLLTADELERNQRELSRTDERLHNAAVMAALLHEIGLADPA
ncbi:DTW domain protein [Planctomycetes bacterium Poly30]|uniref:tRNA-uridine aminocarboxypropyltransferase n=1 Tax=Saltatorellus ferox TaxID=2528018 RepID=A0A518ERP8_9BACT|nr:DTW domain protein [Planctomycetes bacterium Poly30]